MIYILCKKVLIFKIVVFLIYFEYSVTVFKTIKFNYIKMVIIVKKIQFACLDLVVYNFDDQRVGNNIKNFDMLPY